MHHTISFRSNPRLFVLLFILVALLAGGAAAAFLLRNLIGFLLLAAALYLTWQLGKFLAGQMRSAIITTDDDIRFHLRSGEKAYIEWPDVSAAGWAHPHDPKEKPVLFVYCESRDKLLTIPHEYSDFDILEATIRENTDFEELHLEPEETLTGWLKQKFGVEEDEDNGNGTQDTRETSGSTE